MNRLRQLHYFVVVAEEGQVTRAAKRLHLAQPALSQAIAQLESQLGVELFERHPRGVSLTGAGEAMLAKARVAVSAYTDAEVVAKSFARASRGAIEVGFIGPPPAIKLPELFASFSVDYPDVDVAVRELSFPRGSTASWLEGVDVAFSHLPPPDGQVHRSALRSEPRTVVAPETHPLGHRAELSVAEVLDERFIGFHPSVQPQWAAFHNLDDHRGGPPARTTDDRVLTPPQMLRAMTAREGITTVPASDAQVVQRVLRGLVAIPICDADPATLGFAWRKDNANPSIEALVAMAEKAAKGRASHAAADTL